MHACDPPEGVPTPTMGETNIYNPGWRLDHREKNNVEIVSRKKGKLKWTY